MTGPVLAAIMRDAAIHDALFRASRRYASDFGDREELVQEAWLRVARECDDDALAGEIVAEGRIGMQLAYQRQRYHVLKKKAQNRNGISGKPRQRAAVRLYRDKLVLCDPDKLDSWVYDGEWAEIEADKSASATWLWHGIVFEESTADGQA